MNFGKIMLGILGLVLVGGIVFLLVGGDDETASNTAIPQDITEAQAEDSQSAATPADQLPGQTTNPGAGSTETMPLTRVEVSNHNTISDCWTIVSGNVYDITTYVPNHPGGEAEISRACGTDGTALFNANERSNLVDFELGPLEG